MEFIYIFKLIHFIGASVLFGTGIAWLMARRRDSSRGRQRDLAFKA